MRANRNQAQLEREREAFLLLRADQPHVIGGQEVQLALADPGSASGLSYLTMISTTPPEGAKPPFVSAGPLWFGEMRERFVLEAGQWKFLERRGSIQMKFAGAPPT